MSPKLPSQEEETKLWDIGRKAVAGVDEVGRGPIAGPVVAGAVILPELDLGQVENSHLVRDSKTLSEGQLARADELVRALARAVGIGRASSEEIDRIGIAAATRLAMKRALDALTIIPDHTLVDALNLEWRGVPCRPVVKGDARCTAIAAASCVAKVFRDAEMRRLDLTYPGYGFGKHKGYGSKRHLDAIRELGPTPVHRMSFSPLKPRLM